MQPAYGANPADQYLTQRIAGATAEQLAALLLEGAQRFIAQVVAAIQKRDIPAKARLVNRVSAIIEELTVGLNTEGGGELAANLARLYEWWLNELFEGSQGNQVDRLERVSRQMGELRASWEQLAQRGAPGQAPAPLSSEGIIG